MKTTLQTSRLAECPNEFGNLSQPAAPHTPGAIRCRYKQPVHSGRLTSRHSGLVLILVLAMLLAGCSAVGPGTPQALPTVVLDSGGAAPQPASPGTASGGVVASGVVAPAQTAELVFTIAGKVEAVNAAVGETVQAGQPLAQLAGQEDLAAAISQAEYEVVQAQQALDDLQTEAETARVQAMQDIITYERAVRDAQYALDNFTVPVNQAGLDTVEALNQMKQRLETARQAFEPYKYRPSGDTTRQDRLDDLNEAQADYNAAVRRLQYEYDVQVAQAQLDKALADYATWQAGPDPARMRLAEARLSNAQAQLAAAQAALDRLTLSAPFNGTLARLDVHPGEWVIPGQVVLSLADLGNLQVETTDLSERDIPQVEVGQPVTVVIKALGQSVPGTVREIAPLADTLGGDVVYKTTIELNEIPAGLRAGMSVEVEFGAEP
jgi:multidrug efflux pump subunit AcrA (membrane-fusion protein)